MMAITRVTRGSYLFDDVIDTDVVTDRPDKEWVCVWPSGVGWRSSLEWGDKAVIMIYHFRHRQLIFHNPQAGKGLSCGDVVRCIGNVDGRSISPSKQYFQVHLKRAPTARLTSNAQ